MDIRSQRGTVLPNGVMQREKASKVVEVSFQDDAYDNSSLQTVLPFWVRRSQPSTRSHLLILILIPNYTRFRPMSCICVRP